MQSPLIFRYHERLKDVHTVIGNNCFNGFSSFLLYLLVARYERGILASYYAGHAGGTSSAAGSGSRQRSKLQIQQLPSHVRPFKRAAVSC